ncbi:MAG TPA: methyl-accepting chemotaxis protein [Spirochaetia bacterium]|nr:methyl-accepting chemotaxis protein [Spirochaetia bacterium]
MNRLTVKLIGGYAIIVLLMVALSVYTVVVSQSAMEETIGTSSIFLADNMLNTLDRSVGLSVNELRLFLLRNPVQAFVTRSNANFEASGDPRALAAERQKNWSVPGGSTVLLDSILGNEISSTFSSNLIDYYQRVFGYRNYLSFELTNKYGAVIAATSKPDAYDEQGAAWWKSASANGTYLGDIALSGDAGITGLTVAVAMTDLSGNFIGTLKAVLAADDLIRSSLLSSTRYTTSELRLSQGTEKLLFSTQTFQFNEDLTQSSLYRQVRDGSGSFTAFEAGRPMFFAYDTTKNFTWIGQKDWVLLIGVDSAEVLGPIFSLRNQIALASLILVILSILAAYLISRSIVRPIREVRFAAAEIAVGNLTRELLVTSKDEIGSLMESFVKMKGALVEVGSLAERIADGDLTVELHERSEQDTISRALMNMRKSLRDQMGDIGNAANILASSASEIFVTTRETAAAAAQMAGAVSETTTTVEEVKQTSHLSNQKAERVAAGAQESVEVSRTGRDSVTKALSLMQDIQDRISYIAESSVQLGEESQSIGEIIAMVSGLADQSNLLAVNAAIEAAKAGDQGKGFTVVALEIKSLAEQSRRATVQIRSILSDIQKSTATVVLAAEQGGKSVSEGIAQFREAGETIGRLTTTVESAAEAAAQIAASSHQQLVGMDQVATAMESIRSAISQSVDGANQMESGARNLNDLGQRLKELVARYRVE